MTIHPDTRLADLSRTCGLVLLYHSITDQTLAAPQGTVHNVHPVVFRNQLEQLTPFFEFVSIDDFVSAPARTGLASVTFDDGYKNVADNAYPILRDLQIPATSFLNPVTLTGQWNWRDKVRFVIDNGLEEAFSTFHSMRNTQGRFYRYSKHPENNSADIDLALDAFLEDRELTLSTPFPYLTLQNISETRLNQFGDLVRYGNHGMHHYVMSSLDPDQQQDEISNAANILDTHLKSEISNCFSAPFGGTRDTDDNTLRLAAKTGYSSILMSRQNINRDRKTTLGIHIIERFMPRTNDISGELLESLS